MKDNKGQVVFIIAILVVTALIVAICYGIIKATGKDENGNIKIGKNPVATMEVAYKDKDGVDKTGTIKIELDNDAAPIAVANFVNLANNGFYNNLTFHRIISDFMIQGGDFAGDGTGNAKLSQLNKGVKEGSADDHEYTIKGEFAANGVNNSLKFKKGVIGMARADYSYYGMTQEGYNSASSQFFIVTTDNKNSLNALNGNYTSFGKVIEGYDVVEDISNVKVFAEEEGGEASKPENAPVIKSVSVETFGAKYDIPETINSEEVKQKLQQYQNMFSSYYSGEDLNTEE